MNLENRSCFLPLMYFAFGIAVSAYLIFWQMERFSFRGIIIALVIGGLIIGALMKISDLIGLIDMDMMADEEDASNEDDAPRDQ